MKSLLHDAKTALPPNEWAGGDNEAQDRGYGNCNEEPDARQCPVQRLRRVDRWRRAEVAMEMGIDLNEYNQILRNSSIAQVFSIDDSDESIDHKMEMSSDSNPDKEYIDDKFHVELTNAINDLPERERLVMSLYYEEEMNLKEIGSILEVSESRVCQIHGKALVMLRVKLSEWLENN